MIRLLAAALTLVAGSTSAQTTLDITVPGPAVCSYSTGPVTSGSPAGHLQATATSSTGAGCGTGGSGNVTFGPASPLSPATTTLGSPSGQVNFSFQPLNANKCTGTVTPSSGSFVSGTILCNSAAACSSVVSAPAQFSNTGGAPLTYSVSVLCTGTAGSATSTASVVVPNTVTQGSCLTIPSSTPAVTANFTRWDPPNHTANINYQGPTHTVNVTSFDSFYLAPWPGQPGLVARINLPVVNYLSLQFTVPQQYFSLPNEPPLVYGQTSYSPSVPQVKISMSISTKCGDFSDPAAPGGRSTVLANCRKTFYSSGALTWHDFAESSTCPLQEGKTYYLNMINADISQVQPDGGGTAASLKSAACTGPTCDQTIQNGPGSGLTCWDTDHWITGGTSCAP